MIKIYDIVLVTRNARDKIQIARFILEQESNIYTIRRFTGQFGGKITTQPEKTITKGKVKRTVLQQAELEFNSLIKKSVDKGYKKLNSLTKVKFEDITQELLDKIVPTTKTDANGNIKPQLAKSHDKCTPNIFNSPLFCSKKLDGVRCLMKYDSKANCVLTVSRGGGDYNPSTVHIRIDPAVLEMFRGNPNIILDGELYVHGLSLQTISGIARLKTWEEDRCGVLEYWVYDIVDLEKDFEDRFDILENLSIFNFKDHPLVKIQEHILLEGWREISRYHNKWVSEGFEGLVARKPNKKYSPGSRSSDWIKVKEYKDEEFEITGISEGLRIEDICFTLKTKEGKEFKAKIMGTRKFRQDIFDNWEIYVGKFGTVKFFEYSEDKIPMQPIFKAVREHGE